MSPIDKDAFRKAVYDVVKSIPFGRATSYGAIANAIGYPNMSRLVGKMMGECKTGAAFIPVHRVVNSQGMLSGSDASLSHRQKMIEEEGVKILNNRIQNWKHIFWNPLEEIGL